MKPSGKRLEVHEHWFVSGPRSRFAGTPHSRLNHSHEGGDVPHEHPDTGPAAYAIDKDEWRRATGMSGGGRKRFTARPTGEQLPRVELEESQKSFDVFVLPSVKHAAWDGKKVVPLGAVPADSRAIFPAAERMKLAFGMTARVHVLPAGASGEPRVAPSSLEDTQKNTLRAGDTPATPEAK